MNVKDEGIQNPLASANSLRIALEYINKGNAGLNEHRTNLLNRVPNQYEWVRLARNMISLEDLAFLSASTDDEFALFRGKNEDILYHGDHMTCPIEKDETLMILCKEHKVKLIAHTHNDIERIVPSQGDKRFLRAIGQKESIIVSYITGKILKYTSDFI
ncbi:MAG: hypothetical protein IKP88_21520 [Lachnospiraceae bacterium]|nr:hypothetical protein [Lachnospiraceae bacterium]